MITSDWLIEELVIEVGSHLMCNTVFFVYVRLICISASLFVESVSHFLKFINIIYWLNMQVP